MFNTKTKIGILNQYAKKMRESMTLYEWILWSQYLCCYFPPFKPQEVIGKYIIDFYCADIRMGIELDGSHHLSQEISDYDFVRDQYLAIDEIKILRFTNHEVYEKFGYVCELIDKEVIKRRNDLHSDEFQKLKKKH